MLLSLCVSAADLPVSAIQSASDDKKSILDNPIEGSWCGFKGVDLTGMHSVEVTADVTYGAGHTNYETLAVVLDDPKNGEVIGYVTLSAVGEAKHTAPIREKSGTHDVYFVGLYGRNNGYCIKIKSFSFLPDTWTAETTVPDSAIVDDWHDTWQATDDMGRKVADYEEAGAVKTDTRAVGIMYWNWFGNATAEKARYIISEIEKNNPGAAGNYNHPAWDPMGAFAWGEPILGCYDGLDYWVHYRHAKMLANAGVDAIFFDYTNGGNTFIHELNTVASALRDAKKDGVNIPRMSAMNTMGTDPELNYRACMSIYFDAFCEHDYSDVWYYWEGRPLLFGGTPMYAKEYVKGKDAVRQTALSEMDGFFTERYQGNRNGAPAKRVDDKGTAEWMWLENFPQVLRSKDDTGRAEFMSVGVAINQSTILGLSQTGVFSDPYNKGRGFSEVFGEDYSENGKRMGYFFREQAALALSAAPKFVYIDGWNEWTTARNADYGGFENSFVDLYDEENSRDFEPSRSGLKDDYYNLMVDFIRKYKGVRPAPVASGAKTIDVSGDASQWDGVGPEFINTASAKTRDSYGFPTAKGAGLTHYTTTVNNAICRAKVSFDGEMLYFMAQTENAIKTGTNDWMYLYINTDRNHATGWEGYDYAVNVGGAGTVSAFDTQAFSPRTVGSAKYKVDGNKLMLAIPQALLGETGTVDLEFKWTDSVPGGDLLSFYEDGSSAPLGRFNYLYTEIAQTALSESEKASLSGVSIVKAGAQKMIADGAKMNVCDADIRLTAFMENGTLYLPEEAFNDISGYGRSKTVYNNEFDMFFTHHFDMNDELTEVARYDWAYTTLWSLALKVNGAAKTLQYPVIAKDGRIYVPVTYFADAYGWTVTALADGIYAIGKHGVDESAAQAVLGHLN